MVHPTHLFDGKNYHKFDIIFWGESEPGTPDIAHKHEYNELILIRTGGGVHEIDFEEYPLYHRGVHLIFSNQLHQIKRTKEASGCSIQFGDEFVPTYQELLKVKQLSENQGKQLVLSSFDSFDYFWESVKWIQEELNGGTPHYQMLQSLFTALLMKITKEWEFSHETASLSPIHPELVQFQSLVEQHFKEKKLISWYAKQLCISVSVLERWTKETYGISPHQLVQKRLIVEAKRLLWHKEMPINEIASALQFEDLAYFSRFFKLHTGFTPKEFRMQR